VSQLKRRAIHITSHRDIFVIVDLKLLQGYGIKGYASGSHRRS
jgi:hypothetical protein